MGRVAPRDQHDWSQGRRALAYEVKVLLRTMTDFERLVKLNAFGKERVDNKVPRRS